MAELILPIGMLRTSDGASRIELRCDPVRRRVLRDWFERVGELRLPWVAVPQAIDNSPAGLTLEYSSSLNESTSVAAQIPEWAGNAAISLPQILGLGRFTLTAAEELARHKFDDVMVCPALVHHYLAGPVVWRLVALPAGTATRADWSRSDPNAWLWSSPTSLTAGAAADPVHTLGAAIHHALVGDLFPESLPSEEKFARLLRGEIGQPDEFATAIRDCAPQSCQPDVENLRKLVLECIDTRPGRRPSEADARARFEKIEKRLGFDRLARSWEGDDHMDTSDELRRRAAAGPQEEKPDIPDAPEAPTARDDWSDVARRELEKGNLTAALSAAWNAAFTEGPGKIELYLITVQRAASVLPPPRSEIVGTLDRLDHAYSAEIIGEANLLRVAHIRLRYLGAPAEEVAPLLKTGKSEWTRAAGLLLRAFLQVRKGEGFADASRLCGEGRTVFAKMPHGGGESGKYARAFLALLDGIAHVGFVAGGGPPAYYTDALTQFSDAIQWAAEVGARDLFRAAGRWLTWLAWLAGLTPGPDATTIRIATDALLRLHGLTGAGHGLHETPDVPWYDEAYLFPV